MKKAVVLGGTHDHISLIQTLKQKGFNTILVDYLDAPPAAEIADKHIKESTVDKETVLQIAKNENASLVISTCIDSALSTVAYVSEKLFLPCHVPYSTALSLTNKSLMKEIFIKNGIPTSRYYVLNNKNCDSCNDLLFPLVVKPVDANSSKGVTKVLNRKDLHNAVETAFKFTLSGKVIIEEFKEGIELSVDALVVNGEAHLVMISENIKSAVNRGNFTIVKNRCPAEISSADESAILEIAGKISEAYNIKNAPLLIQLIYNNGNISVIEFSSRIGGGSKLHFIRRMKGFDLLDAFVDQILGNEIEFAADNQANFGQMCYLYANPGIIDSYCGFEMLKKTGVIDQYGSINRKKYRKSLYARRLL